MACSDYDRADKAAQFLRDLDTSRDIQTIHASRKNQATCFILHRTLAEARALVTAVESSSGLVRFLEPIPSILKLSPELFDEANFLRRGQNQHIVEHEKDKTFAGFVRRSTLSQKEKDSQHLVEA